MWIVSHMCQTKEKYTSVSSGLFLHRESCPVGQTNTWGKHLKPKQFFLHMFADIKMIALGKECAFVHLVLWLFFLTQTPKAHFPFAFEQRIRDDTEISPLLRESSGKTDPAAPSLLPLCFTYSHFPPTLLSFSHDELLSRPVELFLHVQSEKCSSLSLSPEAGFRLAFNYSSSVHHWH